jgi:hypothetical protein
MAKSPMKFSKKNQKMLMYLGLGLLIVVVLGLIGYGIYKSMNKSSSTSGEPSGDGSTGEEIVDDIDNSVRDIRTIIQDVDVSSALERAGERLQTAVDNLKDAISGFGPVDVSMDDVMEALGNLKQKVDEMLEGVDVRAAISQLMERIRLALFVLRDRLMRVNLR